MQGDELRSQVCKTCLHSNLCAHCELRTKRGYVQVYGINEGVNFGHTLQTTIEWFAPELRQPEKSGLYLTTSEKISSGFIYQAIKFFNMAVYGDRWEDSKESKVIFWCELPTMPQKETLI